MPTKQISTELSSGVEHFADGLKPVTDSMSAAIQALLHALPSSEPATHSSWIGFGREYPV